MLQSFAAAGNRLTAFGQRLALWLQNPVSLFIFDLACEVTGDVKVFLSYCVGRRFRDELIPHRPLPLSRRLGQLRGVSFEWHPKVSQQGWLPRLRSKRLPEGRRCLLLGRLNAKHFKIYLSE